MLPFTRRASRAPFPKSAQYLSHQALLGQGKEPSEERRQLVRGDAHGESSWRAVRRGGLCLLLTVSASRSSAPMLFGTVTVTIAPEGSLKSKTGKPLPATATLGGPVKPGTLWVLSAKE